MVTKNAEITKKPTETELIIIDATTAAKKSLAVLPKSIDGERWTALVVNAIRQSPKLLECNRISLMVAIYAGARLGLDFDPSLGQAYIIPRKGQATFMPGYRGLVELARRSKAVETIHTGIVYEDEEFDYYIDEHGPHLRHVPSFEDIEDRTLDDARLVYVVANAKRGLPMIETMRADEVRKIRDKYAPRNRQGNLVGPWADPITEPEMWLKTAIRRASKRWPLSTNDRRLAEAVLWDEQADRGERQGVFEDALEAGIVEPPTGRQNVRPVFRPDDVGGPAPEPEGDSGGGDLSDAQSVIALSGIAQGDSPGDTGDSGGHEGSGNVDNPSDSSDQRDIADNAGASKTIDPIAEKRFKAIRQVVRKKTGASAKISGQIIDDFLRRENNFDRSDLADVMIADDISNRLARLTPAELMELCQ